MIRQNPHGASDEKEVDFHYLSPDSCYLDAACQTLRPTAVLAAEDAYYRTYNACGGRVKYAWGKKTDAAVTEARALLLRYAGKREKEYVVAFTLNTTYGINLVLHQLPRGSFQRIVTSESEHNSVLLPSMTWAKRAGLEHRVLPRERNGDLRAASGDMKDALVLVSAMSNIDGRRMGNLPELANDVHAAGGVLLVDAAQAFGHDPDLLRRTDFDAAFGSGHKMYGPSIGFIIIKRTLLDRLEPFFTGGGTVTDVSSQGFELLRTGGEAHAILEPGLQNWGGIVGLREAQRWLHDVPDAMERERVLSEALFEGLQTMPRVHLFNTAPSSIVSFHVDGLDAHELAMYLSEKNIMCRSGYFCCHDYLQHRLGLPPLLRVSLGLYNTPTHIETFLAALRTILTHL